MSIDLDKLVISPCINTFGEPVSYKPVSSPSFTVNAVFDEYFEDLNLEDGVPVTTKRPVLGIRLADCPVAPIQNDRLIVRGREYVVREVRIDGHGHAKLMLNYIKPNI